MSVRTRSGIGRRKDGRRSRRVASADLDITPMIDVTFLLLIFFMVTSTMQGTPDQNVPAARNGVGIAASEALIVRITRNVDGGAPVVTVVGSGDEPVALETLPDLVRRRRNEFSSVVLKADGDVPEGFVQRVARAVGEVEGLKFYVGVRESTR